MGYISTFLGRTHIISAVPHCIPVYPYLGLYSLVKSPCLIIRPEINPNFDSVNLQIYHHVFYWAHHILTNIHVYNVKPASWHQTQDIMNERCNLSQLNALFAEGGAHRPWTQNWGHKFGSWAIILVSWPHFWVQNLAPVLGPQNTYRSYSIRAASVPLPTQADSSINIRDAVYLYIYIYDIQKCASIYIYIYYIYIERERAHNIPLPSFLY